MFIPPFEDAFVRSDKWGDGNWDAPRKTRLHKGIDYSSKSGATKVLAPASGIIDKLGFCYSDDPSFRYVQIRSDAGFVIRLLYVMPLKKIKDKVTQGEVVGVVQSLDSRYKGITTHVHTEIRIPLNHVLLNKGFRVGSAIKSLWLDPSLFISLNPAQED